LGWAGVDADGLSGVEMCDGVDAAAGDDAAAGAAGAGARASEPLFSAAFWLLIVLAFEYVGFDEKLLLFYGVSDAAAAGVYLCVGFGKDLGTGGMICGLLDDDDVGFGAGGIGIGLAPLPPLLLALELECEAGVRAGAGGPALRPPLLLPPPPPLLPPTFKL